MVPVCLFLCSELMQSKECSVAMQEAKHFTCLVGCNKVAESVRGEVHAAHSLFDTLLHPDAGRWPGFFEPGKERRRRMSQCSLVPAAFDAHFTGV